MKKRIFKLFTLLVLILGFAFITVKANTNGLKMQDGAQIRTIGNQGLMFTASVDTLDGTDGHGFYLAIGEHSAEEIQTAINNAVDKAKTTIDGNVLLQKPITGTGTTFKVVVINIPELSYGQEITAVSYVQVGETITVSDVAVTRSIGQVALNMAAAGDTNVVVEGVVNSLSTNYKNVRVDEFNNVYVNSPVYETNPANLEKAFITDWNAKFGTSFTEYTYSAWKTSAKAGYGEGTGMTANGDTDCSGTNAYEFFITDAETSGKWRWLLTYFLEETATKVHPKRQIDALLNGGSASDNYGDSLQQFAHLSRSLQNFFDAKGTAAEDNAANDITITDLSIYNTIEEHNTTVYATDVNFVAINSEVELKELSNDGYTFDGYKEGANDPVKGNYTVTATSKFLAPKFTAEEYEIKYYNKEEELTQLADTYTIEDSVTLPTNVELDGYEFVGWYESNDFLGDPVTEIAKGTTGAKEYYAKLVKYVEVTYNFNGGEFVPTYSFEIQNFNDYNNGLNNGSTIGIVPIAYAGTRMNYTWKRIVIEYDAELGLWYSVGVGSTTSSNDITGSENAYVIGSNNGANDTASKAVVEAIFTAVSGGDVYYFNLGTFTLDNKPSASGSWNQAVKADTNPELVSDNVIPYIEDIDTLPQAQKTGYTFNGWYDNVELNGEAVTAITVSEQVETINLYAKFTPISYTITWNLAGGQTIAILVDSYNIESATITLPTSNTMSMEGAQFAGWVDEGGNEVTEIAQGSIGNIELTAQWVLDQASELTISDAHTATLNAIHNDKSAVATILVNPEITSAAKYVLVNNNLVEDYEGVEYIYGENLFSSVADAIANANADTIIYVFGGTHTGDLTISVANITLAGPNYGINYKETRNTEATVSGMINIGANGFTMDGFTYTGTGKAYKVTAATANLVIKNNIITATGTSTSGGRVGIVASDLAINGFTFVGNNLTCTGTAGKNAFAIYQTLTNANISNNKISNGAGSGAVSDSELIRAIKIAGTFVFDNNDCLWGTKNYSIYVGYTSNSCTTVSISNNTLLGSSTATTTTILLRNLPANGIFNLVGNTFDYFDTGSTLDFRYANASSTINVQNNVFGTNVLFKMLQKGNGTVNWSGNTYNGGLNNESTVTPTDYPA